MDQLKNKRYRVNGIISKSAIQINRSQLINLLMTNHQYDIHFFQFHIYIFIY